MIRGNSLDLDAKETRRMPKAYATLALSEPQPHTLLVALNRPEAANAMNTQMGLDLLDLFDGLAAAPRAYRVVVLTGSGLRVFCAGAI
jgi:enoyl-CoA hydratase